MELHERFLTVVTVDGRRVSLVVGGKISDVETDEDYREHVDDLIVFVSEVKDVFWHWYMGNRERKVLPASVEMVSVCDAVVEGYEFWEGVLMGWLLRRRVLPSVFKSAKEVSVFFS